MSVQVKMINTPRCLQKKVHTLTYEYPCIHLHSQLQITLLAKLPPKLCCPLLVIVLLALPLYTFSVIAPFSKSSRRGEKHMQTGL